jgi:spore coat protein CotH
MKSTKPISDNRQPITDNRQQRTDNRQLITFLLLLLLLPLAALSQVPFPEPGPVFRDDLLPKIRLYLPQDSLGKMYLNPASNREMRTLFVFESGDIRDTLPVVGIRFRGNTSRQSAKKSIKISFNTYNSRQSFFGLEKMNLNGEHNDPSVIRSKLCWDLCRSFGVPAPRSNHILLYINDQFWGVYINVEQIDEEFAGLRFGNKKGNLYKCLYPADLTYRSKNPDDYKFMAGSRRAYSLKTNETTDDYTDLAHFIDVLNNTPIDNLPAELDKVLNVGTLLGIMVLDVFTGNWDGPFYNKNNFYLYKNTSTGKFELIPYDLDNTFGIDWFNVDWASRSVYEWSPQGEPRPLYTRILSVPAYRKEYTRLFHEFLNSLADGKLVQKIITLRNRYGPYIAMDPFYSQDYGWSTDDFINSFNSRLAASHVKIGLIPYINTRAGIARSQLDAVSGSDQIRVSNEFRVYPNPASEFLVVEKPDPASRFFIYGINGSVVAKGLLTDRSTRINVSGIANGVYYLKVARVEGVARIIILH